MQKILNILINAVPVLIMIILIPLVKNDYFLTFAYIIIIFISLKIKYHKRELFIFILGFIIMLISEYFFINTGVETFIRNSLFGIMPLWLPFLWGYGFIAIKRSVHVLEN